jgi:hypothetical protein
MKTAIAMFAMLLLFATGCDRPKPASSGTAPVVSVKPKNIIGLDITTPGAASTAQLDAATAEANEFLKLLTRGEVKAAAEKVATSFRKEISGPLTFEEEKKLGYSDSDTLKYLREVTDGADKSEIIRKQASPSGRELSIRGSLSGKETRLFSLRLASEGGSWKVTRFIAGRVAGSGIPTENVVPELAWARETALDFLDSLIGDADDHMLTMTLMTDEFKSRLPAPSVADAGLKYAKKDVRASLNKTRDGVKGYTINTQTMDGPAAKFTGDLAGPGKSEKFTMLLTKQGDDWKVESFTGEPRP